MIWFFLLSGLFLGWSLGANDAANIFGTAVGTRMVRFKMAALVASVFVVLGAVISGAGAAHTLGKLGAVNAIAGSFTVALAAAATVAWMTKLGLPVSTSQAIVGAIVGWNLFTGSPTDMNSFTKIISTWVICPILAAVFSIILYKLFKFFLGYAKIHMLEMDIYTRIGLILVGAFGAYSLGANNIANVMGVFVPASPFQDFNLMGMIRFSGTQQLFLLGSLAIAVGIYTYSYRVMTTVGNQVFKLTPIMALIVVLSESLVLFIFASQGLEKWLISHGLPPIPLVPVSSSQAVVGAVIGVAIIKNAKGINYGLLGKIASGWVTTPVAAGLLSFVSLFFVQNVFELQVVRPAVTYQSSAPVLQKLEEKGMKLKKVHELDESKSPNAFPFRTELENRAKFSEKEGSTIFRYAQKGSFLINSRVAAKEFDPAYFSHSQIHAVENVNGKIFIPKWQLDEAFAGQSNLWKLKPKSKVFKLYYDKIKEQHEMVYAIFSVRSRENNSPFR